MKRLDVQIEQTKILIWWYYRSGSRNFEQGWCSMSATKKILGFRWSRKFKIALEAISLWQNISISIFKFSPFIYTMKACQWNCPDKEREKRLVQQSMRKEKMRKFCFCFMKSFNMIINHFFVSQAHSQPNFCFLISGWRKKY